MNFHEKVRSYEREDKALRGKEIDKSINSNTQKEIIKNEEVNAIPRVGIIRASVIIVR